MKGDREQRYLAPSNRTGPGWGPSLRPLTTYGGRRRRSKSIEALAAESDLHLARIEAYKTKTMYAAQQVRDLHEFAFFAGRETELFIEDLTDGEVPSTNIQKIMANARQEQMLRYADYLGKLLEVGSKNIYFEADAEFGDEPEVIIESMPLPPPPPPEKKGLLRRVFGG